jgi:hypothetical protein
VQAIHAVFADDPEAQLVLLGWQDDLKGAELREATDLDQGKLDYAIRRIRMRMAKAYRISHQQGRLDRRMHCELFEPTGLEGVHACIVPNVVARPAMLAELEIVDMGRSSLLPHEDQLVLRAVE